MPGITVAKHALKKWTKKVPIYAEDLSEGAGGPTWADGIASGLSPGWRMDTAVRSNVNADIMVPYDWLPVTDIKFYFVYAPAAAGGVGDVVLGIQYVLYPDDKYFGGLGLAPAVTHRTVQDTPPFGVVMKETNEPVCIPGNDLLRKRQIQIAFGRYGDLAEDADDRNIYLVKVVMEYQSYQP